MNIKSLLMIPLFIMAATCSAFGQEEMNEAPQILSSDLTLKQIVQEESLPVSFIIIDDDQIIEVMINDEPVSFTPGTTVVIDRAFVFQPGKTVIKVSAMDEVGNIREKKFLVGYQLADAEQFMAEDEEEKSDFFWKVNIGASVMTDSNPTNDPGLPIDISGLTLGIVPDSEQPDVRTSLSGTAVVGYGKVTGFAGLSQSSYAKSANNYLSSLAIFAGGGYTIDLSESASLGLNAIILDINTGGQNFSQNLGFSPSITRKSSDEDGSYTTVYTLEYMMVNFADTTLTDSANIGIKSKYTNLDPEELDRYVRTYALGLSSSGTPASQKQYFLLDYDWKNKWESGLKWDIGFGWGIEMYPNSTELVLAGNQKMNLPLRFSTGIGWEFYSDWTLGYDFEYKLTLSTTASSIVTKTLQGVQFKGSF